MTTPRCEVARPWVALSPLPSWLPLGWLSFARYPPLGTEIVFYVRDLESSRGALEAHGYAPSEIRLQPWGDRDFRVSDNDGYYVRVSEGRAIPATASPSHSEAE